MWPEWLVNLVHHIKDIFEWFTLHTWWGIPLDLMFRFLFLGALQWFLRRKQTFAFSALVCLSLLVGKEVFDTFAVRSWHKVHWPDFLDFEDVASGVLGIACAEWITRWTTLRRKGEKGPVETTGD